MNVSGNGLYIGIVCCGLISACSHSAQSIAVGACQCPHVKTFSNEQQKQLAKEIDATDSDSITIEALNDWALMRAEARKCKDAQ